MLPLEKDFALTNDPDPTLFPDLAAAQIALTAGRFTEVLAVLDGAPANDARVWRLRGQALLGAGRTLEAELPLRRGVALGDVGAHLEYGHWLSITGQFAQAARELSELSPRLPGGEPSWRAELYRGEAVFALGELQEGLAITEAAWAFSRQYAAPAQAARLAVSLGQMHLHLGSLQQAAALSQASLPGLESEPDPHAQFAGWFQVAQSQARLGQKDAALNSLATAVQLLGAADSPRAEAMRLSGQAQKAVWSGDYLAARSAFAKLRRVADEVQDYSLRLWTVMHEAELLSVQGLYTQALSTLYELGTPQGLPPLLRTVRGMVLRRQRQYSQAAPDLQAAELIHAADPLLYWRAQLHLADTLLQLSEPEQANVVLVRALAYLSAAEDVLSFAATINELGELVQRALLDPERSSHMEQLLSRLQAAQFPVRPPRMHLEIQTLGRLSVKIDGQRQRRGEALPSGAVLVLVYLFLHPQQSRNAMQVVLFPEFDWHQSTHYFRVAIRELRAALGHDILLLDDTLRHPRYHLAEDVQLSLDLSDLRSALNTSDLTRVAKLYKGTFFAGLEPESDWVEQVRAELRLALSLELCARLDSAQTPGAVRRAVALSARLLAADAAIADETSEQLADASPDLRRAIQRARRRLTNLPSPT